MATNERNRITGFFVVGFLVGLITMWALVKSGTWKVGADVRKNFEEIDIFWDAMDDCMRRSGFSNLDGINGISAHDYEEAEEETQQDFEIAAQRCLQENANLNPYGPGVIDFYDTNGDGRLG